MRALPYVFMSCWAVVPMCSQVQIEISLHHTSVFLFNISAPKWKLIRGNKLPNMVNIIHHLIQFGSCWETNLVWKKKCMFCILNWINQDFLLVFFSDCAVCVLCLYPSIKAHLIKHNYILASIMFYCSYNYLMPYAQKIEINENSLTGVIVHRFLVKFWRDKAN